MNVLHGGVDNLLNDCVGDSAGDYLDDGVDRSVDACFDDSVGDCGARLWRIDCVLTNVLPRVVIQYIDDDWCR
jgi:hypothetical protein